MSSSSSAKPKSEEPARPPLASTLDIVQFNPANAGHYAKAPTLFSTLQGQFADAALAATADAYTFMDHCIFVGAVVHDPVAWSREPGSEQKDDNDNNMELDPNDQDPPSRFTKTVGLYYIHSSTASAKGEMNIGLVLQNNFDERECGFFVVYEALHMVFNVFNCHRAQVAVIEDGRKSRKIKDLLVSMGFALEGTKRMSVFSPLHSAWRDVMYFAMLDTEWLFKRFDGLGVPHLPRTAWDEMLARHNKEREDLLATEDGPMLKRTSSAETIRVTMTECGAATDSASISGAESDLASQEGESQSRRASLSSQPGAASYDTTLPRAVANPFASDLDGTESSSSSRCNPFGSAFDGEHVSWENITGRFISQLVASPASPPPASSFAALTSVHSDAGANTGDDDDDDDHRATDGRTLLRKMMEESLSGRSAAAGPSSKVREWLDSNFTASSANAREEEEGRNEGSASGRSDGGGVMVDADFGVISDESVEKDEISDEWEVLSGEA